MGSAVRGHFIWHDLLTTHPPAAIAFYGKVIGWRSKPWERDPSYRFLMAGDAPVGGVITLPDESKRMGTPPNWLPYVGTDDAEVAAWEAQRLGGRVIRDTAPLPPGGKFAVLADPQGAVFAAFEPGPLPGKGLAPRQAFSWHELATTDPASAFRFYSALFGWKKTRSFDMGPELGPYQMFGFTGRGIGGMYRKPADMPGPPTWASYIRVSDATATGKAAQRAGATIINGPMEVPGGDWITMATDPQGAVFAVHSLKRAGVKKAPERASRRLKTSKPKKATRKPAKKGRTRRR